MSDKKANKQQASKKQEKIDELQNKYLRALADYQNLEKRAHNEKVDVQKRITRNIVEKFLTVLDDIEKADVFVKDDGLKIIMKHFHDILNELNVQEIDVLNKEYDPYLAEALELVEGSEDNIVVGVIRKGYMLGEDVLRPAQVKVSKKTQG